MQTIALKIHDIYFKTCAPNDLCLAMSSYFEIGAHLFSGKNISWGWTFFITSFDHDF